MPELPEVEVICQGLKPLLTNRRILSIGYNGKKLRNPVPIEFMRTGLTNALITTVTRRAKYLLLPTDKQDLLIIHLGMTGNLGLFKKNAPRATHDHIFWLLDNDFELRYNDTRRFGSIHFLYSSETGDIENTFFATSGPEPFSDCCDPKYLRQKAKGSSQAIKTFIMNGKIIAGVGNIYANESLFVSGIHPATAAGKLTAKQWLTLIDNIRATLKWAIKCGGSTISDFIDASGQKGYFQANFKIYGKDKTNCTVCSNPIEKMVINGRASFFCPHCQPRKK